MLSYGLSLLKQSRGLLTNKLATPVYKPKASIVYGYQSKRSPFDKTSYVDYYVDGPQRYHKSRKPRRPEWDDPNTVWPQLLPAPTQRNYKNLLLEVEQEEKRKIEAVRPFKLPDFRTGDVVEFHMLHSLSEGKGNTYTGLIIGRRRKNSLMGEFVIVFRFCGYQVCMNAKQFSPMIQNLRIVSRGSGNLRSKLYHFKKMRLSKEDLNRPIIRRSMKKRREDVAKSKKGSSRRSGIKFDVEDDTTL